MENYEKKLKEALVDVNTDYEVVRWIEQTFPELKESEDEKIRNFLINFIKVCGWSEKQFPPREDCIAWLEKQSNEPKWCHHKVDLSDCSDEYRKAYYDGWNNCNMQHSQCKSELNDVVKCLINGMKFYYEDNEEATWGTEKWSMPVKHIIEVLEKQGEQKTAFEMKTPEESLGIDSDTYNKIVDDCIYGEQKPINADLKDIVDKEANSIWKEINTGGSHSIIDSFNQFYGICWQIAEAVVDCKEPAEWIQELESKLSNATTEQLAEWKEKYFKVEPAWSEEDNKMIDNIVEDLYAHTPCSAEFDRTTLKKINYLKSLKERVSLQPKQEWSEKDEVALDDALWCCKQAASIAKDENDMGNVWYAENWLKSIKDRVQPQNRWKPSKEQIEAIKDAIEFLGCTKKVKEDLKSLYEQLKKLKG